jgi:hypothetical protein
MKTFYKIAGKDAEILVMEIDGLISFVPEDEANPDYQTYLNPEADAAETK